jgi:glutaryl-CoA transferase
MLALEGIRILDLSRALAGPYCTMMLGDLGADVIKVERPGSGDDSRAWGPPFVGEAYGPYPGESTYFLSANRNKRGITLNLQSPGGQEIVRRLAVLSDVLVENFRTGVLDGLGLGYATLSQANPRLIYCSVSGYGRTGPCADWPGYDFVLQAEGGLMGITGPEDGPPYRVGIPIVDITTGMFAATAILAALRARDLNGQGQLVDVSLLDSEAALLTNVAANHLIGGEEHRRLGNRHPTITPYEAFAARDRWFALGVATERQWAILCEVIGCPDLKTDPRFAGNASRVAHREVLRRELEEVFARRDANEWLDDLREVGLPCGPINSIPDVFSHPQAEARQLVVEGDHPTAGRLRMPGFPYKLETTPALVRRPPPTLGQHNCEVLGELLDYTTADVVDLKARGVI